MAINKLKQLSCTHRYIIYGRARACYLSTGDKADNRKSREYYMICSKCKKHIEVVKDWKTIEMDDKCYFE